MLAPRRAQQQNMVLEALARTPNICAASRESGVHEATIRTWRDKDVDGFRSRYVAAIEAGVDALEAEAIRRARDGCPKYVVSHGRIVTGPDGQPLVEHEYSDTLMLALLRAHRPALYRDRGITATAEAAAGDAAVRLKMVIPGADGGDRDG